MGLFDIFKKKPKDDKNKKYNLGMKKTRQGLMSKLKAILSGNEINEELFDDLTDAFIMADIGIETTLDFIEAVKEDERVQGLKTAEELQPIIVDKMFELYLKGQIVNNNFNINENGLSMFKSQSNQLEKFVNTVNSVKLLNISRLNKFVTSLNQLANKMGNLDRLTEAISNKLSKVLEKLVERLTHAEQTIVKADEIQKRRHELIKKSVKEVSALMKQPMTIEVQAMNGNSGNNGGEPTTPQNTPPQK